MQRTQNHLRFSLFKRLQATRRTSGSSPDRCYQDRLRESIAHGQCTASRKEFPVEGKECKMACSNSHLTLPSDQTCKPIAVIVSLEPHQESQ